MGDWLHPESLRNQRGEKVRGGAQAEVKARRRERNGRLWVMGLGKTSLLAARGRTKRALRVKIRIGKEYEDGFRRTCTLKRESVIITTRNEWIVVTTISRFVLWPLS